MQTGSHRIVSEYKLGVGKFRDGAVNGLHFRHFGAKDIKPVGDVSPLAGCSLKLSFNLRRLNDAFDCTQQLRIVLWIGCPDKAKRNDAWQFQASFYGLGILENGLRSHHPEL